MSLSPVGGGTVFSRLRRPGPGGTNSHSSARKRSTLPHGFGKKGSFKLDTTWPGARPLTWALSSHTTGPLRQGW